MASSQRWVIFWHSGYSDTPDLYVLVPNKAVVHFVSSLKCRHGQNMTRLLIGSQLPMGLGINRKGGLILLEERLVRLFFFTCLLVEIHWLFSKTAFS